MNWKYEILFSFFIAVFTVSMFGCNSCQKPPAHPDAEQDTTRRPYKAFVEQALKKPLDVRVKEYLEIAGRVEPSKIHGVDLLARELIVQRDFQGLDLLEEKLEGPSAKKGVWFAAYQSYEKEAKALLRKWALAHPDQPDLLPYHPNGPELLISMLEDTTSHPLTRAKCAFAISEMELVDLLPRVKKFVDDKTPVPMDNAMWPWTLGGAVKECVQHLEALSKDPDERKPIELFKYGEGRAYNYKVWIYKEAPQKFAPGDTISLSGKGIESAGVFGSGGTFRFGAWQEKEVDANHVVFESNCEATVDEPFTIFTVTAPNATEGKVKWEFKGKHAGTCSGEVYGPATVDK